MTRYGATSFAYGSDDDAGVVIVGFRLQGTFIRFRLPMPRRDEHRFMYTRNNQRRSAASSTAAYEQACRSIWRALLIVIKAKLESVELGIETLEQAFLPQVLLPDNRTVGEWVGPQLEAVYARGEMPQLLPGLSPSDIRALPSGGRS